ncbi:unnamed protein product [Boreogadus saida]
MLRTALLPNKTTALVNHMCLGAWLALCPEYSFVLEDELGVCGCVTGVAGRARLHQALPRHLDARHEGQVTGPPDRALGGARAHTDVQMSQNSDTNAPDLDLLLLMEEDQGEYPDSLLHHFPSQLRLDALPQLVDASVSRTLLTALLAALKANGSQGCSVRVQPTDRQRMEFLTKLGFLEILRGEARSREGVVLGRLL